MRKIILVLFIIINTAFFCNAQELNCIVSVVHPQIQSSEAIYTTLQTAIYEFMNSRKWTNYAFSTEERIECTMLLTISTRSADVFTGTLQIQSRRPIYKSSYNSVMLNMNDKDVQFTYIESQPLDYNESSFTSNLTSLLAYYANLIIGMDFDTYQLKGGTPYFEKAQSIITSAQNAAEPGWKAYESTSQRNRYWLMENILNNVYSPIREALYTYHRKGLDMMIDNAATAKTSIASAFDNLKAVHEDKPGSFLMQVFFTAKVDEIVNIFSSTTINATDKVKVANICKEIDPNNASKYNQITK